MPLTKITSLTNARVKNVLRLRDRKSRTEQGLTIIEGQRELERAIDAGVEIKEVYVCRDLLSDGKKELVKKIESASEHVYEVTEGVYLKIAYGNNKDGILTVGRCRQHVLKELSRKKNPLYLICEGIEKPGNLGAILRSCDAVNIDAVILVDGQTDIFNPNVIRASLGAVFVVPVILCSRDEAVKFLKTNKINSYAAVVGAETNYTDVKLDQPSAIVLGSEQGGLSEFWLKQATQHISIPMKGHADSLNVSVSAGILIYETIRQRTQ